MSYQRFPSISDKVKVSSLTGLDSYRYSFLQLSNAEPNFGLPPVSAGTFFLLSDASGVRGFSSDISNFVLVSAADTKYYTVSGGDLLGPANFLSDSVFVQSLTVLGDLTIFGQITAYQNAIVVVYVTSAYPGNLILDGYLSAGNVIYCKASDSKSLDWGSTYSTFKNVSGKYESVYTSLFTNSGRYETNVRIVSSLSARWESVYNTTRSNSARWQSVYNTFNSNSGKYETTNVTVCSNSAFWSGGYEAYTTVNTYSAEWSNSSIIAANSGKWESTYSTVSSLSDNWGGVYVYVNSNFNALKQRNYVVDTSAGVVRADLPSSPTIGDPITFSDPYYTWAGNFFVVNNGSNLIEGRNQPLSANINGYNFTLVYVAGAQGWRVL